MIHKKNNTNYKNIKALFGGFTIVFCISIFTYNDFFFWFGLSWCILAYFHIKSLKKTNEISFDESFENLVIRKSNKKEEKYDTKIVFFTKPWNFDPIEIELFCKKADYYYTITKVKSSDWQNFDSFYDTLKKYCTELDKNDKKIFKNAASNFVKNVIVEESSDSLLKY